MYLKFHTKEHSADTETGNVNKIYRPLSNRIQTHSASDHRDRWI